ncbi:MAG: NADH-quinone oxidoreductase subunit B [Bacteroidetes bacterium]|nr:NADH-quinone oxidoreductase subunit B [Bacteroidota bacterium]MBS1591230.1 NADH-quinone oxidoreductase subunit B [Bacteroidota bacterium]MBS1639009.1 NADH-quinone oxidoreductase subunit B [Bacteroidota bacterium]MBS1641916.1 NADH-quinone oxidoreductase subunit B [Bacteroidota bacterium]MBS1670594.1 NADH-quinone oxidoreductase subunit B [Bacteroidota bacterium]
MRPVRFNINPKEAQANTSIGMANTPAGYSGEGFFATQLSSVVGLARKNSLWPMPFATSCCGIEFMATMASHYDLARFGAERVGFSPRQCDLLMVMGTIAKKMGPVLKQVYLQMAEPRWVLSVGACASSGGIFDTYSVLQGIDQIIPVDVYVPGCAPRPEAILDGFMKIQELVGKESIRRRNSDHYKALLATYGIE